MSDSRFASKIVVSRAFRLLGGLACLFLAGACGSKPAAPATASPDIWALVDGREIRRDDVEKAYRRMSKTLATSSDEETLTAKLSLLNEYIVQDIMMAKARALKIEVTDAELDVAYADRKKNISDETFQKELAQRNLTPADMREGLRRELIAQKLVEREVSSKVTVTEQDISDFYSANRAQFNLAENAYHIAQIVVTPVREPELTNRSGDDAITPEQAARKTQMLMERLKAGVAFSELALDYSEDAQSAPQGGDLGFVPVSALKQVPAPLRDAVLSLEPGSVKTVSAGGAHTLVLLVAREAAGQRDLSMPAVREGITTTLRSRREQLLRTAYLTGARSDAIVVNYLARRLVESQGKMPNLAPVAPGK